ncbi:efflux RND transporter periplasmic adaptor subunit [Pelistega ratti]|uniref:efflux RND transporter periplasmic adaptor subunit n=1 Tax=Pelistega ratti TaxID=2652177 RepID=UPI0013592CDA|nr:efflux RND transporter periplasmic adaptor subunit [Pelistega ratti]
MRKYLLLLLIAILGFGYYFFIVSSRDNNTSSSDTNTSPNKPSTQTNNTAKPTTQRGRGANNFQRSLVKIVYAEEKPIQEVVSSLGTVIPSQSVIVNSQVGGVLQAIFFEEGQYVKKGDLLAKIDPRTYQAALDQAKGSLAENQARLVNARQDLKRYQTLYKQDSIARQQVDTQQALVRQYEGSSVNLQAAVEQAQINLNYTDIVAPIDGRVGLRKVDVGNLIAANSTDGLVLITQNQPIDVSFSVPEIYIAKLAAPFYQGKSLAVSILNKENATILAEGVLVSMDNQVDTTTGSVKLKARFDNHDYQLFPNQFVNAKIILQQVDDAIVLSNDAIQYSDAGAYVYIVQEDNTIKTQTVQTGIVNEGYTQILSGLSLTDKVVIEGLDRLRSGSTVEIVP